MIALALAGAVACSSSGVEGNLPIPEERICEMNYTPEKTSFSVWAPTADKVELRLYANEELEQTLPMKKSKDGLWKVEQKGDLLGMQYTFRVNVEGKWLKETPGIFARAVSTNGERGAIIDLDATDPEGWANDKRPALTSANQISVYEMHYRDMTAHPSAGSANPGKYISMAEHGTCNAEGLATGLDHLVELGVSHVHLLPTADFGSIDESVANSTQYNWGYEPQHFNTPEGTYSTDASDPSARIKELKTLVQAMHKAGLRVVLDVVYNHTTDTQRCGFELTVPGYFYRMREDGTFADGSGCGNETASDKAMMRKYMIESLEYWVEEYHIDGFRFDLMAIHDIETMNLIRERLSAIDPTILIYGEGWAASAPAYPEQELAFKRNTHRMPGIAAFSDDIRNALRGPLDMKSGGFINGVEGNLEGLKFGIAGGVAHDQVNYSEQAWCAEPTQHISYVTCHDDHNLRDRLEILAPKASEANRLKMAKIAHTAVFTSQGLPFIFCGEEMYRTKQHVGNSYNQPDEINAIDWSLKSKYTSLNNYVKGLIALRKAHPAFCLGDDEAVRQHLSFITTDKGAALGFHLSNLKGKDSASDIIVLMNAEHSTTSFQVPAGEYKVVANGDKVVPEGISTLIVKEGQPVKVKAIESLILIAEK